MIQNARTMKLFAIYLFSFWFSMCDSRKTYVLDIHGNAQHGYHVDLPIGKPPQIISVIPDTGSSNFAVASASISRDNPNYFRFNESQTLTRLDKSVDIHYEGGHWSGFLADDVVKLGDEDIHFRFSCMESIYDIFDTKSRFQGVLGLGYTSLVVPDSTIRPFFDTLVIKQKLNDIFSMHLCGPFFTSAKQDTSCGKLHFGYISPEYLKKEIVYTPVFREWYYEVRLTNLKVENVSIPIECADLNADRSFVDSGATELRLPSVAFHWTINEIKKHVAVTIPVAAWINETYLCVSDKKFDISVFPTITISLYHTINSTFDLVVSPQLYLYPLDVQLNNQICFTIAMGMSDKGSMIGATILKGFYVIFDRVYKRIGFVNVTHEDTYGFIGAVTEPLYTSSHNECKNVISQNSDISTFTIICLLLAVVSAIVLLYMLVSWIYTRFLVGVDNASDTSSLVEENECYLEEG